ncbi:hypothetical protein LJC36_04855, partial [Desulfovibrio sp. OttesenSCG-928-C14]|nr:hypothetical protein [Desulfovibrio sp. OttesenSCG-928-C14]
MNKYVTILILGVVAVAMILVWSVHNRQLANEDGKESLVVAIDSLGNEVSREDDIAPQGPRIPVALAGDQETDQDGEPRVGTVVLGSGASDITS